MNTGVKKAYAGLIGSGMLALAAVTALAGAGSSSGLAGSPAAAASMSAPTARESFSNPVNVSRSRLYDNTPDIGASPINGAVTIGWERRDVSGNENDVMAASNTSLGGPFQAPISLETSGYKQNGNVRVRSDASGVRHVVDWEFNNSGTCDYYAQILPTGAVGQNIAVPGSCNGQKNVASAVGPDGSVNVLFGKDLNNIGYYRREANGTWSVTNEYVPVIATPKNIAITVSSRGVVMAAYVDRGPAHNDVYTTTRNPDGTWTAPEDITANVRSSSWNNPHSPSLDKDPNGGIRMAWTQATRNDGSNTYDDVFYREWVPGTGWNNQPIVQLTDNAGNSYLADIAVDWAGQSHIAWQDDTGRGTSNFAINYAVGSGRTFVVYGAIFPQFGSSYTKEVSLDVNPPIAGHTTGNVHATFGSVRDDPQKENYYSWADIVIIGPPPPTFTPVATATPCPPGYFLDVHPTDYFYQAVHDLSIAGVISGYSDCNFRPLNDITRGQAAKIMVLAANIMTDTTGGPHFSDVPPTNTFYNYVETAYNAGVISGYSDHTFRPGANVTRGQASKMIVNAFQLTINVTGGPHFTDVPRTNAFYSFIETAYNDGLISGYSDHTFKPQNNITRGQAAKIIDLARNRPTPTPTATHTPEATVTTTPVVVTPTPTETPVVVTATPSDTPVVVTATPTETQVVVTATATATGTALANPRGSTR